MNLLLFVALFYLYPYIQRTVQFYWPPAFLGVFLPFQRLIGSKKTARLKREWLFFIKFSIKMPEFNRFPPKAYALGLRILACGGLLLG